MTDCKAHPTVRLSPEDIAHDGHIFNTTHDNEKHAIEQWHKLRSDSIMKKVLIDWRFAVTDIGFFAMVPLEAEEGDQAVVLRGGKVPLVLRRVGDWEGGRERYIVVGGAYVHGFMDGEARLWVGEGKLVERGIGLV